MTFIACAAGHLYHRPRKFHILCRRLYFLKSISISLTARMDTGAIWEIMLFGFHIDSK